MLRPSLVPRTLASLLSSWRSDPEIGGNVVAWRTVPGKPAEWADFPTDLHPALAAALQKRGIQALYTHQAAAWEHIRAGKNIVVVTGTASGKTLCYNLPVLDRLSRNPQARALYLFPTKALAQDQAEALDQLTVAVNQALIAQRETSHQITSSAYDGDTPSNLRSAIRSKARVVISNPDMLHTGILPHHTLWADFFRSLQFVVVDEIHTYRGVFGSHVANVLRRLKRVAYFYGASPQFILTSATIDNPVELGERLVEEEISLIDHDGAARGARHFLLYDPPVVDRELGIRKSAVLESVRLAADLLRARRQTIIFGRSRRTVEMLVNYLRQDEETLPGLVRGYRSGYLPAERRRIERSLREGEINTVVATNALELGIDIGGMEAAILVGYPGTIAATWQQAGRAGRKTEASLAVLVTSADALDQFLARHPEYLFERSPERALINPDNLLILLQHLRCAAFELPFRSGEPFGRLPASTLEDFLQVLAESGELHPAGERYFWMADQYPADTVSLRSASPQSVLLQIQGEEAWRTIGEVDLESAAWMVHPQAVYLHDGQSYLVEDLNLEQNIAHLERVDLDYYTEPRRETTVEKVSVAAQAEAAGCSKAHGELLVTTRVTGYRQVRWYTHEQLSTGLLDLPPTQLHTTGYWITVSDETVERLREQGLWKNDANDYGPNWGEQRDRARLRDGFRCQVCHAPENGRAHHVHHKIPFRNFTSYQHANQLDNLVTLCPTCHRVAEAAVRMRSGLAGLAYVLGHLAPLFLMCDSRDLGVHSDPQAPVAEGKPAVVLYDEVPAGIGFSERLFEFHDELLRRSLQLVRECECSDGCPSCVGPAGENGVGGKKETLALLEALAPAGEEYSERSFPIG
ncbi:MAG: DEAD/DEAH box helicase [Chloroflexi bacterium]|nr:DEAD/DEAH box helicase [Chloroflexota bacterium]